MNVATNPAPMPPATRLGRVVRRGFGMVGCRTGGEFAAYAVFLVAFVATLAYFSFVDVYDNHFLRSDHSAVYNVFRVIFMMYLFWLISFVGQKSLALAAGTSAVASIRLHERLALGFFVGGAVLTIIMLGLGYLDLYWRAVAALIAIPIVGVSCRDFVLSLKEGRSAFARFVRDNSVFTTISASAMLAAVVLFGGILLLVKGLYPQGGHDYYQHYSQFYSLVIDKHGIWPNDFWYHYYYSKGMGLTFLSMLLTDPLAPSLVAFCFVVAAAIAVYSLVARICPGTLWPWVAVVLYLALNVHTVGTGAYAANGGWGHFQKPHEINSPFLIAILWASVNMVRAEDGTRRIWWLATAACCFIVAYLLIISSAVAGLFFLLAALGFFFVDRGTARAFFGLAIVAGVGLVSVLVLNYVTTGVPSDVGINVWWPIIDFRWLNDAGTLFDVTNTAYRRAEAVARGVSFKDFDMLDFIKNVGRFDILGALMYGALAGAAIWVASKAVGHYRRAQSSVPLGKSNAAAGRVLLAFLAAVFAFTVVSGSEEPISYVRASSFALPLMVAVAAIIWQVVIVSVAWSRSWRVLFAYAVPVLLASVTIAQAYDAQKKTLVPVMINAVRFVDGRYSIYDAYKDQSGWPALPNSRAIYPGIYEAFKIIGKGKRLWSFNVHGYCMVPGCRAETILSSKMSANRAEILFGSADVARAALQRDGLNYFFISTFLDIRDPLICTPLFSPDTIRDYMGVKWTNGGDVLLTWKGPGTEPLSAEWVDRYRAIFKTTSYTPDCSGEGPPFSAVGKRVHDDVMKGKRWGWEIEPPK